MPRITVQGKTITCDRGDNLRSVLLKHNIGLYNGGSRIINCRGIGSCGTCAIEIEGEVSPINWKEQARLSFPPHSFNNNVDRLRLACQVRVLDDIKINKYGGFWGEKTVNDNL